MFVPTNNLKAALEETRPEWRAGSPSGVPSEYSSYSDLRANEFEREFASAMGAQYAAGVGSGTAALELCLRCAEVPEGSEALTTPLTAPFTGVGIQAARMRIRFADIDPGTLSLVDPYRSGRCRHPPDTRIDSGPPVRPALRYAGIPDLWLVSRQRC